jgi:acyl-CoA thioester hydrolase
MSDSPNRAQFRHFTELPVRWGDMDMLGHINNVIFFRYIESARIAYFDHLLGADPKIWGGEGPILAEIQCRFIQQLHYPAQLEIGTRTLRIGGRSLQLECAIFRWGEEMPAASSRAAIVWFDYKQQAAVTVPEALRETIRRYEVLAPQE